MQESECERVHAALDAVGMRAAGSSAGLLALLSELHEADVLSAEAVGRIKEAIIADISLHRPRATTRASFERMVRERMDALLPVPDQVAAA